MYLVNLNVRYLLCILIFAYSTTTAQVVSMKEGKVSVGDSVYFHYKKLVKAIYDSPIKKGENILNYYAHPEATGDAFQDIVFGTEHQQLVKLRARLFASAQLAYLVYYYNVEFVSTDVKMNFQFHPLLVRTLVKDMVKYNVIEDGFINEKGVRKLAAKWKKKDSYMPQKWFQDGVVNNYNVSKLSPEQKPKETIDVSVQDYKIFHNNAQVATYKLETHTPIAGWTGSTKNSHLYCIRKVNGDIIAWVKIPVLQPVFHLLPAGAKESFQVVTTDKDEQKIIATAMKVLIVMNKDEELTNN